MTIQYPVAPNAEAALSRPLGRASREREAVGLAGEPVAFTSEPAGPAFVTREAALAAHAGRVEDERPGHMVAVPPEDRFCRLAEILPPGARPPASASARCEDGRRWSRPPAQAPRTVWRLMVSYWRIATAERPVEAPQARQARRRGGARSLDGATLRAMASQPLQAVEPQQPLDIGLFERRLPESPHIVVPDE